MRAALLQTWLRRALLLGGITYGLTVWGVSEGRAQLRAALEPVVEIAGALEPGAQRVWVNGLQFEVRADLSPRSPHELLNELERECDALDAGLGERVAALWPGSPRPSSLRLEAGGTGFLTCLDLGAEPTSLEALASRLTGAAESGDLARVGGVRMSRVRRAGEGAHQVTIASKGPLPLELAFPAEGDAPGIDIPGVPRPPRARRILSAHVEGQAPRVASYAVASEAAVEAWLKAWRAEGWTVERGAGGAGAAWYAVRGAALAYLGADFEGPEPVVTSVVAAPVNAHDGAQPADAWADNGA